MNSFISDNASAVFTIVGVIITSIIGGCGWIINTIVNNRKSKNKIFFDKSVELCNIFIKIKNEYFTNVSSWTELSQKNISEENKCINIKIGYDEIENAKTLITVFFPDFKKILLPEIDICFEYLFKTDIKQGFHKNKKDIAEGMEIASLRMSAQDSLDRIIDYISKRIRTDYIIH